MPNNDADGRYVLFRIDDEGRKLRHLELFAVSDEKAIAWAEFLHGNYCMELWQNDRLVRGFDVLDSRR